MTTNEAKKDCAARLSAAGVTFTKLKARTVSFEEFGYGSCIFVEIHGGNFPPNYSKKDVFGSVPKPSAGGYATEVTGAFHIATPV